VNGEPILRTAGLAVGYRAPVLSGIDLNFGRGQFIALLGPNGAGKTTLLRTLSRHLQPLAGTIEVLGQDLNTLPALDLARIVAVCLTDNAKPPLLPVDEFVALGRYPHTGLMGRLSACDAKVVAQSLAAVAAGELADRLVEQLSDGERQKVILARALAQQPKLMLLDEPTAHLDLKHRIEVMSILRAQCRSQGLTVLAALHDIDLAAKISDRVLLVRDGGISDYGLPEAVLTSDRVAALYDLNTADFNRHLGSIEFHSDGRAGAVFVIAGRSHAAPLFRLLSKKGLAIATGVLDDGDLDAYVAAAIGARVFLRSTATAEIGVVNAALAACAECDFIIDSGAAGVETDALRAHAAASGRPFLRLTDTANTHAPTGGTERCYATLAELSSAIDHLPFLQPQTAP
jgi:iron complex transport system ATP-binding protein